MVSKQTSLKYCEEILDELLVRLKIVGSSDIRSEASLIFPVFRCAFDHGYMSFRWGLKDGRYVVCEGPLRGILITRDTIIGHAKNKGWITSLADSQDKRCEDILLTADWWEAWTFAWSQSNNNKRRKKTPGKISVVAYCGGGSAAIVMQARRHSRRTPGTLWVGRAGVELDHLF